MGTKKEKKTKMSEELINAIVERNMTKFYKLVKTVNVNIADPLGMKPIHYVVRLYPDRLLIDVIRTLKENGADLNAKDKFGDRPMHLACCRRHPVYALSILEQNGASVDNYINDNGANALHFLFCPYSECTEFENIYKSLEFLLVSCKFKSNPILTNFRYKNI